MLQTSITVCPALLHIIAHVSFLYATFHTLSLESLNSRTGFPVCVSNSLTRPSFPPVTKKLLSNCNDVTDESWAAMRCRTFLVFRQKVMTRPSDPPVARMVGESCSWHTNAVCPCKSAKHCL